VDAVISISLFGLLLRLLNVGGTQAELTPLNSKAPRRDIKLGSTPPLNVRISHGAGAGLQVPETLDHVELEIV
jgi:hypothetical protein